MIALYIAAYLICGALTLWGLGQFTIFLIESGTIDSPLIAIFIHLGLVITVLKIIIDSAKKMRRAGK